MDSLLYNVKTTFEHRAIMEAKKRGIDYGVKLNAYIKHNKLWFIFIDTKDGVEYPITVPIPYKENGVVLINDNEVKRSIGKYYIKNEDRIIEYTDVIYSIICGDPTGFIQTVPIKKSLFIQQIIYSFNNNNTSVIIYNLQKAINEVINKLPLYTTDLNSWVMNHRLFIVDKEFDDLRNPMKKLDYQTNKAKQLFHKGWTPIGLSDSAMADKNYILTEDIRKLTPFGMYYHNPQRNLYSTLAMKGDEYPLIRSESAQKLMDKGISRKGWNFFTLFADIPDVFEDQILVDITHANKFVTYTKKIQCFGEVTVKVGQKIETGQVVEINNNRENKFDTICDSAIISRISKSKINVGNTQVEVSNLIVKYKKYFKDGTKLTNTHGNKGVIRLKKLGYAIHPVTKEKIKIDIIVSAKSIKKRKNYGQIIEALTNNLTNNNEFIVSDEFQQSPKEIIDRVIKDGFVNDGKWECNTYIGNISGICGKVFWGVIKDVETAIWSKLDTKATNNKGIRTAGLKFSSIEFKALETRFGMNNAITKEIMSYSQGKFIIEEQLKILKSKCGELDNTKKTVHINDVIGVDPKLGSIVPEECIKNTIGDSCYYPDGFIMILPVSYQIIRNKSGKILHEGNPVECEPIHNTDDKEIPTSVVTIDRIYIPKGIIRSSWKHSNGNYGLNNLTAIINNLININIRYNEDKTNGITMSLIYKTIMTYFKTVSDMLGGKRGDISTYGMSVRYPNSVKGVATLSNSIDRNTVEISKSMAEQLKVKGGDIVLVERFPCLGFMSLRPQRIKITHDTHAKYTIRVSGNSLVSLGLDLDGDVIYLASFHTKAAKKELYNEWKYPNKDCYNIITKLNNKAGEPTTSCLGLSDYNIQKFSPLTCDDQTAIVSKLAGVKLQTGPIIALVYNLLRVLENTEINNDQRINVLIEEFMDKAANSVFAQKHGTKSLHEIVMDSICTNNPNNLILKGFNKEISILICTVIKTKAEELGVTNLENFHELSKKKGTSNILSFIVRNQNKIYFASRAKLESGDLLDYLKSESVDLPSKLLKKTLNYEINSIKLNNVIDFNKHRVLKYGNKFEQTSIILQDIVDKLIQ